MASISLFIGAVEAPAGLVAVTGAVAVAAPPVAPPVVPFEDAEPAADADADAGTGAGTGADPSPVSTLSVAAGASPACSFDATHDAN
jgi:hypothetical protein